MKNRMKIFSIVLVCALCLLMMLGSMRLPTLWGNDDQRNDFRLDTDSNNHITSTTIVKALINALNNSAKREIVYRALHGSFDGSVSLNEFNNYLTAISNNQQYKVKAFYRLDQEHKQIYVNKITSVHPTLTEEAAKSTYYRLLIVDERGKEREGPIISIQTTGAKAVLNAQWLNAVSDIYEYSQIYYRALEKSDRSSVEYLLLDSEVSKTEPDKLAKIIANKVDRLLSYYHDSVTHRPTESKLKLILPYYAEYERESYAVSNDHKLTTASFTLNDEHLVVEDPLQDSLDSGHVPLYIDGVPQLFTSASELHQFFNSSRMPQNFGSIDKITVVENNSSAIVNASNVDVGDALDVIIDKALSEKEGAGSWQIDYTSGVKLVVRGYVDVNKKLWAGNIVQLSLTQTNEHLSFGGQLQVGMSLIDFYQYYPFIRETGYRLTADYAGTTVELSLLVADDKISGLTLKILEE